MTLRPACIAAALLLSPPALAQEHAGHAAAAEPGCDNVRAAVPGFDGWSTRVPMGAGARPAGAPVLAIGAGADLRLGDFTPAVAPEKASPPGTKGGLAQFQVRRAGVYRVGLGSAAWVDVLSGGKAVASVAHGHGPRCTGIRKIVDFRLAPGRYLVQLTGATDPAVAVLVARRP